MVPKMFRITQRISQSAVIWSTHAETHLAIFTLAVELILNHYAPVISLSMLISETNIDDCITMMMTFLNMTVKLKRGG